jgi:hypothetical protein
MPYIKNSRRLDVDEIVYLMATKDIKADGDLNYILFKYCKNYVQPGYNNYKNFCGELRQCVTEIERRLLGPYEEIKIIENGDVN